MPIATVEGVGPASTFFVNLSGATNATIAKAQGLGTIQLQFTCNDGNAQTHDFCDPSAGCKHVDLSACSLPGTEAFCKLPVNLGNDADGDGLPKRFRTAWPLSMD